MNQVIPPLASVGATPKNNENTEEKRLSDALRINLARRKEQARARAQSASRLASPELSPATGEKEPA